VMGYLHASQLGALTYKDGDVEVQVPPQTHGVCVYAGFPPDYKDKNYDRPIVFFDVKYDPDLMRHHLDAAASLWTAAQSELASEDLAPKMSSPDFFPCASVVKRTGQRKTWCPWHSVCWGEK
jgi:hypothetical protein